MRGKERHREPHAVVDAQAVLKLYRDEACVAGVQKLRIFLALVGRVYEFPGLGLAEEQRHQVAVFAVVVRQEVIRGDLRYRIIAVIEVDAHFLVIELDTGVFHKFQKLV